jgi:hypothetical protein
MKNEDRLFELYKIYIPVMYEYNQRFDNYHAVNLGEVRADALDQAEKALEYFNSKIEE